jgi:hypothetical protein
MPGSRPKVQVLRRKRSGRGTTAPRKTLAGFQVANQKTKFPAKIGNLSSRAPDGWLENNNRGGTLFSRVRVQVSSGMIAEVLQEQQNKSVQDARRRTWFIAWCETRGSVGERTFEGFYLISTAGFFFGSLGIASRKARGNPFFHRVSGDFTHVLILIQSFGDIAG